MPTIVACIAADTNHVDSFRQTLGELQPLRARRGLSLRLGRAELDLRVPHRALHAHVRRDARGLRQALRRAARQRAEQSARAVQEAADARRVPRRAADRRSAPPVRLRDAVRGRRGVSRDDARSARATSACRYARCSAPSSGTTRFPTIRSSCAAAGRSTATISTRRPASARATSISSQTYDDYPVITCCSSRTSASARRAKAPTSCATHTFTFDGTLPLNTSGGQLSVGQAGAAGGFLGLTEAIRQLTGAAARRAGRRRAARPRQRLRHDQLRPRPVQRRRRSWVERA